MESTPNREPDPPQDGGDQARVAVAQAAQGADDVAAAPADQTSSEAVGGQPAAAAENVEHPTPPPGRPARSSRSQREGPQRRPSRWLLTAGVVVLAGIGVGVWLAVMAFGGTSPTGPDTAGEAVAHVPYRDPQGRFNLSYPSGWQQEPSSGSQAALLLRTAPSSQNSMLVRIVPLDDPVGPEQLTEAKKLTDSLVEASDVNIVVVRQITLNGVPGYYYLYTFGEPGSDRFGLHAHYFLFSGSTMHVLVFQALPDTEFVDLAPDFDAIARSYRVL